MVTHPSDQSLQLPGHAGIRLAQKGPAPTAFPIPAQNQEIQRPPNNGRSVISEDLFTPFAQTSFARSGMHLGLQFPMRDSGIRSTNPLWSRLWVSINHHRLFLKLDYQVLGSSISKPSTVL